MNKGVRILIAAILFLGILFLAGNQIASAGNLPWQTGIVALRQNALAQANPNNRPGTVKPPRVVLPPITTPGTFSVGGVCTLVVGHLATNVTVSAHLMSLNVLNNRPKDISRYLAGVCDVTFSKSGKPVSGISSGDGSVKICFAVLPNVQSKIYFYDGKTWTALDTTVQNGLDCTNANSTGRYVLAAIKP